MGETISIEYQTVVTNEGNITDKPFYADFFKAISAAGVEVREAEKAALRKAAAEKAAAEMDITQNDIAQVSTPESTGSITK